MADLEAPERNKPLLFCQKCFAIIPDGAEYCAECGAPVLDDFSEGSDSAVYPELARANLLRMRGEYKVAEDICLSILRRHPNSATANTLLGDICAERGDLKQAAEWYEMALDILPDSESDRHKLEVTRRRIKEHEAAETAKHLGLPESRPKIGLWVGGLVVFVLLVATVAYLLGEQMNARRSTASRNVSAPVSVPKESSRTGSAEGTLDSKTGVEAPTADLLASVRSAAGAEASRIVGASRIPENMGVLLTMTATGTEDARLLAAQMGKAVLTGVADAPQTTLIVLRAGKVDYVGTVPRDRFQATTTEEWKTQNGDDSKAFADAVLTEEWPPPAPISPSDPGTNAPDGGPPDTTGL